MICSIGSWGGRGWWVSLRSTHPTLAGHARDGRVHRRAKRARRGVRESVRPVRRELTRRRAARGAVEAVETKGSVADYFCCTAAVPQLN